MHETALTKDRFASPIGEYHQPITKKLRQVLSEMEEQEIKKSISEYASPLVLMWKKYGSLRLHRLQMARCQNVQGFPSITTPSSDCLAALGGNTYFSTMDLIQAFTTSRWLKRTKVTLPSQLQ